MIKVSAYVKGDESTPIYYRIHQYTDKIEEIECKYRQQMSTPFYKRNMPIGHKMFVFKVYTYFYIFFRILLYLIKDLLLYKPNAIIIHRNLIGRYMPYVFKLILIRMKNQGCQIIWDYDDHIIESREVSMSTFDWFAKIADTICVTHLYLKALVPLKFHDKVVILPTTDGDLYIHCTPETVDKQRENSLHHTINLIWIGTSVNLSFLKDIIDELDKCSQTIADNFNRKLTLTIVCDKPLKVDTSFLIVRNISWSRAATIKELQNAHIGIMPLRDNVFTRGKGGFKLVQYISVGLPCIASNVGYNNNIVSNECGFLVKDLAEWSNYVIQLSNVQLWKKYSNSARHYWKKNFSFESNLEEWKHFFIK